MFTHEVINYNKQIPMKLFFQRIGDVSKHWHQSLELLFVLKGTVSIHIESEQYFLNEGDIILINPQQIHETHSEDCMIAMLQIRLSMFHAPSLHENIQFHCNSALYPNKDRFSNLIRLFAQLIQINSGTTTEDRTSLLTISYAYQMMHELMLHFYTPEGSAPIHSTESLQRLKNITTYIEAHYSENITLKSMAEQQFLSASYLSHFFEKNMNMTFSTYLTGVRLNHALQELLRTDHYIEEIAANNGFPNSRAFVTAFRKQYRMLPSQYRNDLDAHKQNNPILDHTKKNNYLELEKHDFLSILNQYLEKNKDIKEDKKDLSYTTGSESISMKKEGTPLSHTFRVFTSVGHIHDLLLQDVQEMLTTLQKEIGYRYIKFHGILDDRMMLYQEDASGKPLLSFAYIDKALDFLQSIGLKPLIQFSFMPKKLAALPEQTLFATPVIISPPKDESKWCFLIEQLTMHFIKRYGIANVREWFFTFWNETLSPTPFAIADIDTVYHLYKLTYRSVKKCDSLLQFGNPSLLVTTFPEPVFTNFLAYCKNHDCMPDIHIFHFYPIAMSGLHLFETISREEYLNFKPEDIRLSQDPDLMNKFILSHRAFAKDYPTTKSYLTEWCSTSSHRDWLNDTCFRSAYILKNILENYDLLDSFGNWTLTDMIEELTLEDQLFHGGMGIFTRNGIKKPAFYAFAFLNRLQDYLLQKGAGYFITSNRNHHYTFLLYNYHHYSTFYAQGLLFDASPESRYDVFGQTYALDMELILDKLQDGTYHMSEQIVNRSYGSCYDEWIRMGGEPLTTSEEVAILKSRSVPMLQKSTLQVTGARLTYFAHLEPHEIRLVELNLEPSF